MSATEMKHGSATESNLCTISFMSEYQCLKMPLLYSLNLNNLFGNIVSCFITFTLFILRVNQYLHLRLCKTFSDAIGLSA